LTSFDAELYDFDLSFCPPCPGGDAQDHGERPNLSRTRPTEIIIEEREREREEKALPVAEAEAHSIRGGLQVGTGAHSHQRGRKSWWWWP
jgi:hypothetical protein